MNVEEMRKDLIKKVNELQDEEALNKILNHINLLQANNHSKDLAANKIF